MRAGTGGSWSLMSRHLVHDDRIFVKRYQFFIDGNQFPFNCDEFAFDFRQFLVDWSGLRASITVSILENPLQKIVFLFISIKGVSKTELVFKVSLSPAFFIYH